jgi:SAM-dependent methyltransferase
VTLAPDPLTCDELAPALAALEAGEDFKSVLEALLLRIPLEKAELLMLILREGRGAWHLLCEAPGGTALFIGNAFSGTVQALAASGYAVTVCDSSAERLAFCAHRTRQWTVGEATTVELDEAARLPFDDDSFDLVVQEEGAPSSSKDRAHTLAECRRLARAELVLVADNRLGYKRSSGWRGRFEVPSPPRWVLDALRAPRGERSLFGWRKELDFQGCEGAEAWSLYPTSLDFTFVAGIDHDRPQLYVGPKERQNPLKVLGQRLGLFGALSPSFALRSARTDRPRTPRRLQRILDALAERLGEPAGLIDHLVATRGNSAVVLTRGDERPGGPGDWCLHIPLSRQQRVQIERHHDVLERLPVEHPSVPAPRALFRGELEGLWLSVERRLPGLGAPQLAGETAPIERMLRETAERMAQLTLGPPEALTTERFAALLTTRFDLVRRYVADARVERALDRMHDECRERLVGAELPLVLHHADLRSKHLQVSPDGALVGILDWGSSTDRDLPYFDLLHLVVHERKQADGLSPAAAWRLLLTEGGLRAAERGPLERYAEALRLPGEACGALERAYPVFVAAMAEANWDYSRPRWLERMFQIARS